MTSSRTILVDLRATQFNGDRGIPAYAQSLTAELVSRPSGHRWLLLHDARWPLPARAAELATGATWCTAADLEGPQAPQIDAVLTGCFFLPHHGCGADYLWPTWLARQRPRRLGIVYDLVQLVFPERYLSRPRARRQYLDALRVMRQSDQLFAISHASRRDAIRHAAVDPARVDCIYGDIDHHKRQLMQLPAAATAAVPARHGLQGPYCVCVGGDDWRKNMPAAVRAFAAFHAHHPGHQLAVVCKLSDERIADLHRLAASLGLPTGAVICTGFVSDDDLVGLVRQATLLVYPSLYEGLGLPVLEAYGCGTPAVGSNTSSVAELVLPELACYPENPAAIAAAMANLVASPTLRARSLAFGRRLLDEELGWTQAADRVLKRIEPQPRRHVAPVAGKPHVAVVGVLPPARTGIAPYTLRHLQSDRWQTTLYEANPEPRLAEHSELLPDTHVVPVETLPAALLRGRHDAAIFVLGNSSHHVKVLDAMIRTRGTVARRLAYLHEAALESLFRAWLGPDAERLPDSLPPATAPEWIVRGLTAKPGLGRGLRLLAERAELDGLIVNSLACRDLIRAVLGPLADSWSIDVAFLPVSAAKPSADGPPVDHGQSPLRIGTFGLAGDTKRLDLIVRAAQVIRGRRPVEILIAGWEARRFCRRMGLSSSSGVTVVDAPDDAALEEAMRSVHVAVQLRTPTFGESSGVVSQLLALGTPVVVTGEGSFAELPPELASLVAVDCSVDELASAIEAAARGRVGARQRSEILAARSPEAFAERLAAVLGSDLHASSPTTLSA